MIDQGEGAADFGLADAFSLVCYTLAGHALFLECEVGPEGARGPEEEDGGCDIEGLLEILCQLEDFLYRGFELKDVGGDWK